MQMSITLC